jgi:pilus assembly protein CpaB
MQSKAIIPLVLGIGVGLLATKMILDRIQKAEAHEGDVQGVVVTTKPIKAAERITGNMLSTTEVPSALVPLDVLTDLEAVLGRIAKISIPAGVPVSSRMLAPRGTPPGLQARIPRGYLAVSVKVTEATAVAGFLAPGAFVDVFATTHGRGSGSARARRILVGIEVAAVGQSLNEVSPDGKKVRNTKTVTLFLMPNQVPILQTAERSGAISLALRGTDHVEELEPKLPEPKEEPPPRVAAVEPVTPPPAASQPDEPVVPQTAPPQQHVVEVRYGSRTEKFAFDKPDRPGPEVPQTGSDSAPSDGQQ